MKFLKDFSEKVQNFGKNQQTTKKHAELPSMQCVVLQEKERRMEVLQHRKKRRLRMSPTEVCHMTGGDHVT